MGSFFVFTFVAGITLLALYSIYKLLLGRETFHRFNRVFLLASIVLSLAAGIAYVAAPAHTATIDIIDTPHITAMSLPQGTTPSYVTPTATDHSELIARLIAQWVIMAAFIIYAAGLLFFIAREVYTALRMARIIGRGCCTSHKQWRLILHDDRHIAPFSWGRYMVMSQHDYDTAGDLIVRHEEQHLRMHHWADLLVAECTAVILWYNPAGWLMRDELQSVHEYEADEAVLNTGIDAHQYQLLLIKKAVGDRFPSIANSLSHSNLKKRITMMLRKKSHNSSQWRALAALPALGVVALLLGTPVVANNLQQIADAKVTKNDETTSQVVNIAKKGTTAIAVKKEGKPAIVISDSAAQTRRYVDLAHNDSSRTRYIVDGREVTAAQLEQISAQKIANIIVDKSSDVATIKVITKAAAEQGDTSIIDSETAEVLQYIGTHTPTYVDVDNKTVSTQGNANTTIVRSNDGKTVSVQTSTGNRATDNLQQQGAIPDISTYVIDGTVYTASEAVAKINPNDIASAMVVKSNEGNTLVINTKKEGDNAAQVDVEPLLDLGNNVSGLMEKGRVIHPKYIVDGREVDSLSGINPDEIESIRLYRGNSPEATRYNAGEDGVIIVTRKKK